MTYTNGSHLYYPELGDRAPELNIHARMSAVGEYYIIDTPIHLKGRGITEMPVCWQHGTKQAAEGWRSYRVTFKAFDKLEQQYPIAYRLLLD